MNRILIAEDEPRIAAFIEKGLRSHGFTTSVAVDAKSAADIANSSGKASKNEWQYHGCIYDCSHYCWRTRGSFRSCVGDSYGEFIHSIYLLLILLISLNLYLQVKQ